MRLDRLAGEGLVSGSLDFSSAQVTVSMSMLTSVTAPKSDRPSAFRRRKARAAAGAFAVPFILAAAAFWSSGCNPLGFAFSKPTTPATLDYKDTEGRFSIKYPADWKSSPSEGRQVVIFEGALQLPDEVAMGVIIATLDATASAGQSATASLDQYIQTYSEEIKKQGETVFATASTTLSGQPAQSVDHSIKVSGKTFKSRQVVTIKEAAAYQLSFLASPPEKFDEWLPVQKAVADSFKILK